MNTADDILLLQLIRRMGALEQRVVSLERMRCVPERDRNSTAEAIVMVVCQVFEVSSERVHSSLRTEEVAWARMLSIYLIVKRLGWHHTRTGEYFNRHHTSVGHAMKTVADRLSVDSKAAELLAQIEAILDKPLQAEELEAVAHRGAGAAGSRRDGEPQNTRKDDL